MPKGSIAQRIRGVGEYTILLRVTQHARTYFYIYSMSLLKSTHDRRIYDGSPVIVSHTSSIVSIRTMEYLENSLKDRL